jgi:hypothetical protein
MFARLTRDQLVGAHWRIQGDVVAVDGKQLERLVKAKAAIPDPGPATPIEIVPPVETAALPTRAERATAPRQGPR